jgi:hypothetical protein
MSSTLRSLVLLSALLGSGCAIEPSVDPPTADNDQVLRLMAFGPFSERAQKSTARAAAPDGARKVSIAFEDNSGKVTLAVGQRFGIAFMVDPASYQVTFPCKVVWTIPAPGIPGRDGKTLATTLTDDRTCNATDVLVGGRELVDDRYLVDGRWTAEVWSAGRRLIRQGFVAAKPTAASAATASAAAS